MIEQADPWIKGTTTACVALLALIAGTVSYLHMHALVALHGQPGWVAALTPLSVDGMIVAASTTLLAESRSGTRGGVLPWALLVVGSIASLTANVAVAEPTLIGRVIAAWPSFALTASYELLTRQVRRTAGTGRCMNERPEGPGSNQGAVIERRGPARALALAGTGSRPSRGDRTAAARQLRRQAWEWALANRASNGAFPSGKDVADHFGRHERWGRLVKQVGLAGRLVVVGESGLDKTVQDRAGSG